MPIVSQILYDDFVLRDNANAAVTGKVQGDFATVEAYLVSTPATTAAVTLAENANGKYKVSFTPSVVGTWAAHVVYNSGGLFREFAKSYDVISASQGDPIAYLIANNITAVTVVSPTVANGSISGIVRGDDYTVANAASIPITLAGKTIPGGATVAYTVYSAPGRVVIVKAMTITAAGPPAILTLELPRHDTLRLPVGVSNTAIVQTTAGGAVTTLVDGTITVVTVP